MMLPWYLCYYSAADVVAHKSDYDLAVPPMLLQGYQLCFHGSCATTVPLTLLNSRYDYDLTVPLMLLQCR